MSEERQYCCYYWGSYGDHAVMIEAIGNHKGRVIRLNGRDLLAFEQFEVDISQVTKPTKGASE